MCAASACVEGELTTSTKISSGSLGTEAEAPGATGRACPFADGDAAAGAGAGAGAAASSATAATWWTVGACSTTLKGAGWDCRTTAGWVSATATAGSTLPRGLAGVVSCKIPPPLTAVSVISSPTLLDRSRKELQHLSWSGCKMLEPVLEPEWRAPILWFELVFGLDLSPSAPSGEQCLTSHDRRCDIRARTHFQRVSTVMVCTVYTVCKHYACMVIMLALDRKLIARRSKF